MRPKQVALANFAGFALILLTACSSSYSTNSAPATPVFTSMPVTNAVEGSVYTYQLATSSGKDIFALSSAPAGATLSGDTISWVPASAQSRKSNSFTVTATSPAGTSATQSWTVTPNGTIRISWIDTLWNESGSIDSPFNWTPISPFVAALVPQPDGSFKTLSGTPGSNGDFEIPNVPAGYYWLRIGGPTYWTSSSTFDTGTDRFVLNVDHATTVSTTTFNFSFTSLDATATNGRLQFTSPESFGLTYSGTTAAGSTTFTGGMLINGNVDFSNVRNAFAMQYKPTILGSLNGLVLGPELTLTNLSLTTGGVNTISGTLQPAVAAAINLSIEASAWVPMFDHIAPAAPTVTGGAFYASVQPYTAASQPDAPWGSSPIILITTFADTHSPFVLQSGCSGMPPSAVTSGGFTVPTLLQPMLTDVETGTVQYNDPFPAAWRRTFSVCQNAAVDVPVPGQSTTQSIVLTNSQTAGLPTDTVRSLIWPVQSPKINGADLFTASTINSSAVTLSWSAPAIGAPFGYQVTVETPGTLPDNSVAYHPVATFSTAKTSMTIPTDLLVSGHSYLFMISALVDGRANMETSPHRSSLPVAQADLISAPQIIGTGK